jgi:hypothetical protein
MPLEQYNFGAGTLFLVRTDIVTPTPTRVGTLQDVSVDMSFDAKEFYGQYQAPAAVARGKMKITGKAKFAKLNARALIVSVEAGYGAALAAENEYLASGKADPAVVKTLRNARTGVAGVLDPIAAAAAKGTAPTSDQALAAQTALSAFQAALQANGLAPKITTTGSK